MADNMDKLPSLSLSRVLKDREYHLKRLQITCKSNIVMPVLPVPFCPTNY